MTAASWCGDCAIVKFDYNYVDEDGDQQVSSLVVTNTNLVDCGTAGIWCPMHWEVDGPNGPGFDNGYGAGKRTTDEQSREMVVLTHNASRFACCNKVCGTILLADYHRIPKDALPLQVVFGEAAASYRSKLPDDVGAAEWHAYTSGNHWPCIAATDKLRDDVMYITMGLGNAPIRLNAPFFEDKLWCSEVQLLDRIVWYYKLTGDNPFGKLAAMPTYLKVFVHDTTVTGKLGHHGREGLQNQKGLYYDGPDDFPAGWPLAVYTGIVGHESSSPVREADKNGTAFNLDWESLILAPDERNIAQFANDASLHLYSKRNHIAALPVNAVFVTLYIWGVPVPMLVSTRKIKPGYQIAADYGKSYKPGAM
jgi:hypothetical protein